MTIDPSEPKDGQKAINTWKCEIKSMRPVKQDNLSKPATTAWQHKMQTCIINEDVIVCQHMTRNVGRICG